MVYPSFFKKCICEEIISLSNYSFWYLTRLSLTIIFVARCFKRSFLKFCWNSVDSSALKLLKTWVLSSFADLYYSKVAPAASMPSAISATWADKACSASSWPASLAYWWSSPNNCSLLLTCSMNDLSASFASESLLSMWSIQRCWRSTNFSPADISALTLPHCSERSALYSSSLSLAASASLSTSAYSSWLVLITFKSLSLIF